MGVESVWQTAEGEEKNRGCMDERGDGGYEIQHWEPCEKERIKVY